MGLLLSCGQQKGHAPGRGECKQGGGCYLFFLSGGVSGIIGTKANADSLCNSDANRPNDSEYKAVINYSDRTACTSAYCSVGGEAENVDWVLYPATAYFLKGETFLGTTNKGGVFFDLDERLASASDLQFYYMGTNENWTAHANTCTDWTTTIGSGGFGSSDDFPKVSTGGVSACSNLLTLLCAEQ